LNNLSGRIAKDQQKLSTQFEAYKKLVATFEKSLAFFESLGKQVEDKKED
jgi:hypothetical protein